MKPIKTTLLIFAILVLTFCLFAVSSFAHSGRTDSRGGHRGSDGYHYHHGYSAHQHENGVCPYSYDDKTNHDSKDNSNNNNKQNSHSTLTTKERHISGADILSSILVLVIIGINIYLLVFAIKEKPGDRTQYFEQSKL